MSSEVSKVEGKTEKIVKKSLFILGGLAVASVLLPPVGAAIATGFASAEAFSKKLLPRQH